MAKKKKGKRRIAPEFVIDGEAVLYYTEEDVMQAVCAALLFGEDASRACAIRIEGDYATGTPIGESVTVGIGAMRSVTISAAAADLLYRAHYEQSVRGIGEVGRVVRFDLRKGM